MNRQPFNWKFWVPLLVALLLFAVAAASPAWVAHVPGTVKSSIIDSQVVVGLISLIFAILTLSGAAVYFQLRKEILADVRDEITGPLNVESNLSLANMAYLGYLRIWDEEGFDPIMEKSTYFRWLVETATRDAWDARIAAQALPEGREFEGHRAESRNTLGFHLATRYKIFEGERDREEAIRLLEQLDGDAKGDGLWTETTAWIRMCCYPVGSVETDTGRAAVARLLIRTDIPLVWREHVYQVYTNLFDVNLPKPN